MERKKYYLSNGDFIINTMIDALQYEDRRVIDMSDIISYQTKTKEELSKQNIAIVLSSDSEDDIEGFLEIYDDQYVVLPWIEREDLIRNFRGTLPWDVVKVVANIKRESFLSKRTEVELENFDRINYLVASKYLEVVPGTIESLEARIEEEKKKLTKIKRYVR